MMNELWAFESWVAFFAMGKHGLYVWGSYGASFILLVLLVGGSFGQFYSWKKREARRIQRQQLQETHQGSHQHKDT